MKKKILIFSIIIISILIITGCDNTNENVLDENISFIEWFQQNVKYMNNVRRINCPDLTGDSIMYGEYFVNGGKMYKYNVDKLYSNETNCKLIGTMENDEYGIAINNMGIINNDGILYNDYWANQKCENCGGVFVKDNLHDGWVNYFEAVKINTNIISSNNMSHINQPNYDIITYVDGELVAYYRNYMDDKRKIGEYKIDISSIGEEDIINLYNGIIKTNKSYYYISRKTTNASECNKYVDIECEYKYYLEKDDTLTKYYNEIMNIDYAHIITNNYEVVDMSGYLLSKGLVK